MTKRRSEPTLKEFAGAGRDLWRSLIRTCPMATTAFVVALVIGFGRAIYADFNGLGPTAALGLGTAWFNAWLLVLLSGFFIRTRWAAIKKQAIDWHLDRNVDSE